ncbi:MAG: recombinase family protein [Pseudomonadota bacterium]
MHETAKLKSIGLFLRCMRSSAFACARDAEFHLKLKREMDVQGAIRKSPNFNFLDTPEGEFIETIIAAQGVLERKQNGRQVAQKMRARMENGYYVHAAPIGYVYRKVESGAKCSFTMSLVHPSSARRLKATLWGDLQRKQR